MRLRSRSGGREETGRWPPMETHLSTCEFLVGGRYSLADISLYAYTHVADEGGFDLGGYPEFRAWIDRIAAQPGHVPMDV